jgi:hypothetical protein
VGGHGPILVLTLQGGAGYSLLERGHSKPREPHDQHSLHRDFRACFNQARMLKL